MSKAEKMAEFLNKCHSVFHAAAAIEEELKEAGFLKLQENENWKLENNRYYYVMRNDTSIIAFKIPEMLQVKSVNISATHSDSPTLKIKPVAMTGDPHYGRLNVEVYGGAILSSWLDRPLSIAGRAVVNEEGTLVSKLVDFDYDSVIIPNVAIHQNRQINDGYKWNAQVDMMPMVSLRKDEKYLLNKIADYLTIDPNDIYGYDMFLYNRTPAYVWGDEQEFISSPRLDDLGSAYAALQGFKNAYSQNSVNIYAVFDNEEVGAVTRQGMASNFLADVISRIFASFFYSEADKSAILANSFMISADNAHAVHPNHPEFYDADNRCYLNGGVVIKRAASQSYVTDAVSEAVTRQLCERAGVSYQYFANRSDNRGGGTQAAIASINLPSMSVDIGLPQLAMHSAFETAGAKDVDAMVDLFNEFYGSTIIAGNHTVKVTK
ncbi:MAG: M18 family aminopeptidase [Erysipelotrichaceae bacterium]|nr:M18 family aminopeptidase [Erysipelotrichaceae bacterium]